VSDKTQERNEIVDKHVDEDGSQQSPRPGKCCGLDIHKKTCTAAIVSDDKQPIILSDLENSGPGMKYLCQQLVEEGCSTVVMESTGSYWMGAYDYLELRGINTVLVCPRSLKAVVGKKNDESDASVLANMYRIGFFEPSYVPPRHIRELRALTRRLEKITKMTSSVKNSIQSQVNAFSTGVTATYTDPFGLGGTKIMKALATTIKQGESIDVDKVIEQLREEGLPEKRLECVEEMLRISFDPTSNGWLIEQGLETLRALDEQKELLLNRIAKHIEQHKDLSRYTRTVMTMRGIALVSAAAIVAEMGDPTRFPSSKSVSSYFGLSPNIDQSGPKTVRGSITKAGSRHMRRILGQIACVVCVRGDPHMKRWYAQIAKRRGKHIAKTALSRKILVTAWAMMRDNQHYHDPDQADSSNETLRRNKLRELEKRSQQSERTVSMWKAIQRLATDKKLRAELGLSRILPPSPSK
jgi:transposase